MDQLRMYTRNDVTSRAPRPREGGTLFPCCPPAKRSFMLIEDISVSWVLLFVTNVIHAASLRAHSPLVRVSISYLLAVTDLC